MTPLLKWLAFAAAVYRARRELYALARSVLPAVAGRYPVGWAKSFGAHKSPAWWDWSTWDREMPS